MREEPQNITNPSAAGSIYFTHLSTGKMKEKNVPWLFFQHRIIKDGKELQGHPTDELYPGRISLGTILVPDSQSNF